MSVGRHPGFNNEGDTSPGMKVWLIQPSQLDANGRPIKYTKLFMPFLTMTTRTGLTPDGIDMEVTEDYLEDIDLVGLTSKTCQTLREYQIADEFRKRDIKTIVDEIHSSVCRQKAFQKRP